MQVFLFSLAMAVAPGGGGVRQAIHVDGVGSGAGYQQLLLTALRQADRVVLTEHSNKYDSFDPVTSVSNGPYQVYASHQLSDEERARLITAVAAVDPQSSLIPMCLFSPHHAVDFYVGDQRESRLEICFTCGEMEWDAVYAWYPYQLIGVFAKLVEQSGMETGRDWRKHLQDMRASQ